MLLENTRDQVNYHFKDSKYDVSISGLAFGVSILVPFLNMSKQFNSFVYQIIEDNNCFLLM